MAARFFCDNCGTEVKRNSSRCPDCGRLFGFVRCPQCGYRGRQEKFSKGCPVCGYCAANEEDPQFPSSPSKPPMVAAGKLPFWVYIVAFLSLSFVALVLYLVIK